MLPIGSRERWYALRIARQAMLEHLRRGITVEHQSNSACLLQLRGAFVTLRRRDTGELRGCRGEYRPQRPLIESVIRQAIASATDDPRFPAVEEPEVPCLSIRINALTALRRIESREIDLGRHGLVVQQGRRSGLLLPEVPRLFGLRTPEEFLKALYRKAGLPHEAATHDDVELFAFETEAWGDDD
jgi:AmmeMemoRadiSam system protein A